MPKIDITEHAKRRMQQRAISELQVRLIQEFGVTRYQKGGGNYQHIPEKILVELRRAVDKLANVNVVLGEGDKLITVMHETRRIHKTQYVA